MTHGTIIRTKDTRKQKLFRIVLVFSLREGSRCNPIKIRCDYNVYMSSKQRLVFVREYMQKCGSEIIGSFLLENNC